MPDRPSLIGQKFTRALVLDDAPTIEGRAASLCLCDCGLKFVTLNKRLISGNTKSCGCLKRDARITHGQTIGGKTPTYGSWCCMFERCTNPKHKNYARYGGRGITICDRWRLFENFLADMGARPPGKTIHRIDNGKNYTPENCAWATHKEQCRATERSRTLTVLGVTACFIELCEHFNKTPNAVRGRFRLGWTLERAFTEPLRPHATKIK